MAPTTSVVTASVRSSLRRTVRLNDRELFRRVQRAQALRELTHDSRSHSVKNLTSRSWRWRRHKKSFDLFTRQTPTVSASGSRSAGTGGISSSLDPEVLAVGNVACTIADLMPPLRSPSESDYNAVMHVLLGSDFIYGSLVHTAYPVSQHHSQSSSSGTGNEDAGQWHPPPAEGAGSQMTVKTATFVHSKLFAKKNEQMCYVELFSPTDTGGFTIAYCSLAGCEITLSKALSPLRRSLHQLHPFTAWFSAEPVKEGVHVVFRARYHRAESDSSCATKVATARLWRFAKGICRLGKLVQGVAKPPSNVLSGNEHHGEARGHRNSRCIVCTRSLHNVFHSRRSRCCELCAYNVCDACCSIQQVEIYSRHVAPLLICARCRDCLARDEFASQLRAVSLGDAGGELDVGAEISLEFSIDDVSYCSEFGAP